MSTFSDIRLTGKFYRSQKAQNGTDNSSSSALYMSYVVLILMVVVGYPTASTALGAIGQILKVIDNISGPTTSGNLAFFTACVSAIFIGKIVDPVRVSSFLVRFRLTLPISRILILGPSAIVSNLALSVLTLLFCFAWLVKIGLLSGGIIVIAVSGLVFLGLAQVLFTFWLCGQCAPVYVSTTVSICILAAALFLDFPTNLFSILSSSQVHLQLFDILIPISFIFLLCNLINLVLICRAKVSQLLVRYELSSPAIALFFVGNIADGSSALKQPPSALRDVSAVGRGALVRVILGAARSPSRLIFGVFTLSWAFCLALSVNSMTSIDLVVLFGFVIHFAGGPLFDASATEIESAGNSSPYREPVSARVLKVFLSGIVCFVSIASIVWLFVGGDLAVILIIIAVSCAIRLFDLSKLRLSGEFSLSSSQIPLEFMGVVLVYRSLESLFFFGLAVFLLFTGGPFMIALAGVVVICLILVVAIRRIMDI